MIAKKWGFSRTRLDEYSALSHERAAAAQDAAPSTEQIVPVFVDGQRGHGRRGNAAGHHASRSWPGSSPPSPRTA